MSFIIVFSNLWAIRLGEWRETRTRTLRLILTGIGIVFLSTLVVGVSNYLAAPPDAAASTSQKSAH